MEAARLRVEAALARGDAKEAELALAELPLPLDEELAERVELLVEQDTLVASLRDAVCRVHELGADALRKIVHRAEAGNIRSMPASPPNTIG